MSQFNVPNNLSQHSNNNNNKKDVFFIIGDWNAKEKVKSYLE